MEDLTKYLIVDENHLWLKRYHEMPKQLQKWVELIYDMNAMAISEITGGGGIAIGKHPTKGWFQQLYCGPHNPPQIEWVSDISNKN